MDSIQHEALRKMFLAKRLQPGIPEHDLFIEAELAKLKVLEPHDYESFKEYYDMKKKEFESKPAELVENLALERVRLASEHLPQPPAPEVHVVEPKEVETKEEPKEEVVEKPKKKKKKVK